MILSGFARERAYLRNGGAIQKGFLFVWRWEPPSIVLHFFVPYWGLVSLKILFILFCGIDNSYSEEIMKEKMVMGFPYSSTTEATSKIRPIFVKYDG